MDFELTEEQRLLVGAAKQFAKKTSPVSRFRKLRASAPGWEREVWRVMGEELGWLALPLPEAAGGLGGSLVDVMLLVEQLGRSLVPEPYLSSVILAGMTVAEAGTPEQVQALLTPLAAGRTSLAFAYAERDGRYHPGWVGTRAERDGSDFVLSGEKVWVLDGDAADHLIVSARTAGGPGDEEGITLFVVPGDASGLARSAVHGMDGRYTGLVRLDRVRAGTDAVLGGVDQGLAILSRALDRAAAISVAEGLGIAKELLSRTVDYLKTRKQFGVPIGSFQALQHRAAEMHIETEMLGSMAILAALKAGESDESERVQAVSAAKVQLADSGWFVSKEAIQLHGGIGCTDELDVGLFFKRMRVLNALFGDREHHLGRLAARDP